MRVLFALCSLMLLASCGSDTSADSDKKSIVEQPMDVAGKYINNPDEPNWQSEWNTSNSLVVLHISEPGSMHPTNGNDVVRAMVNDLIHTPLMRADLEQLDITSTLLEGKPLVSEDGLEYTYVLRSEPIWDDGEPLSIEDVRFTLMANLCPLVENPSWKPYLLGLKEFRVGANREFTLVMKEQYTRNSCFLSDFPVLQRTFFDSAKVLQAFTVADFADPDFDPASYPELEQWAKVFNSAKYGHQVENFNGLGAYRFESWDRGQGWVLSRKEGHWTSQSTAPSIYETAYPEQIVFKINTDPNSQTLEFHNQQLDAGNALSADVLFELRGDEQFNQNYHSAFVATYNYTYAAMNMRPDGVQHQAYFTDREVRKAMALLTPVDDMIQVLNKGTRKRALGPVSTLKEELDPEIHAVPYDVEGAKELLSEAGWQDSNGNQIRDKRIDGQLVEFSFKVNYLNVQPAWSQIAEMMKESFYEAGIEVVLNPMDLNPWYQAALMHDFDMMLGSWSTDPFPDDHRQIWHSENWANNGNNFVGFANTESDALIEEINRTLDEKKRIELSRKFQRLIYEEQPYIFLTSGARHIAIHKRFGNADMYYDRPGLLLNNLRLLGTGKGNTVDISAQ